MRTVINIESEPSQSATFKMRFALSTAFAALLLANGSNAFSTKPTVADIRKSTTIAARRPLIERFKMDVTITANVKMYPIIVQKRVLS